MSSTVSILKTAIPAAVLAALIGWAVFERPASAYPPAVGITGKATNCLACHSNDGPWKDDENLIIDLLDKETGISTRQADGSFLLSVKRNQRHNFLAVIGRANGDTAPIPNRNGWTYVDPTQVGLDYLGAKVAPGWDADLTLSCRLVGDKNSAYDGAKITVLPITVRPTESAVDSTLDWQILMTGGEATKGDAKGSLIQNYFERRVLLKVVE